jgi:signal transduction histidine kinase
VTFFRRTVSDRKSSLPRVRRAVDPKILGPFTLALAILLTIGVCLYRSASHQAETTRWVARTHGVLAKIQELILRLTDAETGRRGFIMTGRDRYLVHYTNAVQKVNKAFGELRELTQDNLRQQQACRALEPLIHQRLVVHAESIQRQLQGGMDSETQLQLTEKGQEVMEEIRRLIDQIDTIERALLQTRQATSQANLWQTRQFALIGSAASLMILVWVAGLLLRENARRRLAEQALQKTNEELELRVRERTADLAQTLAGYEQAEREIKKLNEELERRVSERTAQLENANEELEAFSYSVSHDLRAPLRHISGFVSLLRKDLADALSPQNSRYLNVISDSAQRLGKLIDDLLLFSRTSRAKMHGEQVNMGELVKDTVNELLPETQGRQIEWQIGPLPTVFGDRPLLKQVWVNLLSNAVKYTRKRDQATIQIHCRKSPSNDWQFSVQDNGSGFDMRYADKLFGVFQRLHRADEFEGTGIGLANVRRIVNRHGGRSWAEGKPGEGATFYFVLPDSTHS